MNIELFPLSQVVLIERVRDVVYDDPAFVDLYESIKRYGLLQPILLDQTNTLQCGHRRFCAYRKLHKDTGDERWATIPVHRRERLTEAEYFEVELEENFRRKDFTWQEVVEAVCRVHTTRSRTAALTGNRWTYAMTGDLLGGYSDSYVCNCFSVRPHLTTKKFDDCTSITDALRILYREKQDEAVAEQARRMKLSPVSALADLSELVPAREMHVGPKEGYSDQPCSKCFDTNGKRITPFDCDHPCERCNNTGYEPMPEDVVDLSHMLFHGALENVLPGWPEACVDHIICDPPYGIDVDMMQQQCDGVTDHNRIRDTHEVDSNLNDMCIKWLPNMFRVLKDGGFCIFWTDQMNWGLFYNWACDVGFKVQRWPLVWCKTSPCKNASANQNFTKSTEIAMVCRKGNATLPRPVGQNFIVCDNDAARESNPFAKPYEVWKFCVESVSTQGQTILDPFAGEGSSIMSFLRLNRRVIAVEKDVTHYNYMLVEVKKYFEQALKKVRFV